MKIKNLLYLPMFIFLFMHNMQPVSAQDWQVLKDVWPGMGNSSSNYNWMAEANGKLFFSAEDGTHGMELWVSDGTDAGTTLLKDIYPGTTWSDAGWAGNFAVCNNKLFFIAKDGIHGAELWATDGTEDGTLLVKDIGNDSVEGPVWNGLGGFTASGFFYTYNNKVYFPASDGQTSSGQHDIELWCSDGTEAGTYMVKDIRPDEGSTPNEFCEFNGLLYFQAYDGGENQGGHGGELWVTDGTETGTHLFKDIAVQSSSETPQYLTVCGNKMFFTTDDGIHGKELWVTDGTDVGTHMVKDIRTDGYGSYPRYLTPLNGILYFTARSDNNPGTIWRSDGTETGTFELSNEISDPINLKVYNNKIFFIAADNFEDMGIGNYELFTYDESTGIIKVKEINPDPYVGIDFNPGSNFPEGFVEYNNRLYFRASDDGWGTRLWQTDGTEKGTIETPGPVSSYPDPLSPMFIMNLSFQVYNGSLYYPGAYEDDLAIEVYKLTTDPTPSENILVVGLKVYYSNGLLYIESDESLSGEVNIFDISGRSLSTRKLSHLTSTSIPVSNLVSGTYIVSVVTAQGRTNAKVFIQ